MLDSHGLAARAQFHVVPCMNTRSKLNRQQTRLGLVRCIYNGRETTLVFVLVRAPPPHFDLDLDDPRVNHNFQTPAYSLEKCSAQVMAVSILYYDANSGSACHPSCQCLGMPLMPVSSQPARAR